MNYFELFGFKEIPVIDRGSVAEKYFALQKKFHPDFFTNEMEADKEMALQASADINKAFNIFKSPEKTIEYFLQLKGIIASDEKYNLPPDFLMDMMELNEGFEGGGFKDTTIAKQVADYEENFTAPVNKILSNINIETFTSDELQQLKEWYYKKKYLKRILDRLND